MVEVDGSDTTVRKTYSAGSTSLAVRTIVNETSDTLNWLLSDHLGSSSITTTADGTWNSEIRYSAFGETRYSSGITPTDYRYTGQLEQADVNLYYYNARYYDAALGRFIQADTIVPEPGSSIGYNRYTYVRNNLIIFTDPSGHGVPPGICAIAGGSIPQCQKQGGSDAVLPKFAPPSPDYSNYKIYFLGPYGVGDAVSERSKENINPEYLKEEELNNQYPLQPLMEWADKNGIAFENIDLIWNKYPEGTKQVVASDVIKMINVDLETNPNLKIILVSHSAGTVSGEIIYNDMPDKIGGFVALGPVDEETNLTNAMDNKLFVGYDATNKIKTVGENFHDYSEFGIGHYNLSVNHEVMKDIYRFLHNIMD